MKRARESGAGLIALTIGGALALNYPLLALFDRGTSVFGIPLPFVHLFVVWALLILGIAALVERIGGDDADGADGAASSARRRRADG